MKKSKTFFAWISIFTVLLVTGCSKKIVPVESIKVLTTIRTAVSIQSEKQLEKSRSLLKTEVESGKIPSELAEELESVFEFAEKKQWQDAEKRMISIQENYKPDPSTVHDHKH